MVKLVPFAHQFSQSTGIQVNVSTTSWTDFQSRLERLGGLGWQALGESGALNTSNPGRADVWLVQDAHLSSAAAVDALEDLSSILPADSQYAWSELPQAARSLGSTFAGHILAIPLYYDVPLLFYR